MRLQFLGDSRDAFKWDLLQWLVTRAGPPFTQLLFIPLLTPDIRDSGHGKTAPTRFPARPAILDFVRSLRGNSQGLMAISRLGGVEAGASFDVHVHAPHSCVPEGADRPGYWHVLRPSSYENTLAFLDPDNGFEIKSEKGAKWVLDSEVRALVEGLPASSAVAVYQQRPRRQWHEVFAALTARLTCATYLSAVHEASLAFVLLARKRELARRLDRAAASYVQNQAKVQYTVLKRGAA